MATLTRGGAVRPPHIASDRPTPDAWRRHTPTRTEDAAARRALRLQIARLEKEHAATVAIDGLPLAPAPTATRAAPALRTLGQLESARDELLTRLRERRRALEERAAVHAANRELVERMYLEPHRHRFVRVSREDIGETGCGGWHVRPRLGLIGMLAGWWHVKLSSGCPSAARLAAALR
jgi:hypothetical protein